MDQCGATPFGSPDGAAGPFETDGEFVLLDRQYGPAARPAAENSRARVIAGTQGVGKTLLLRRLNEYYKNQPSVYCAATYKSRELDTESVVQFSQKFPRNTNTEDWTLLWDRAIHASAATHILFDSGQFGDVSAEHKELLRDALPAGLRNVKSPRDPITLAGNLIRSVHSAADFRQKMFSDAWSDLGYSIQKALRSSRELYIFIDAIDDNYRYAPTYWQQCQRGLFHAVMDTQRTEVEASKLHVVISIRDLTLSSISRSEHATRYLNNETIIALTWSWDACREFLCRKLALLDAGFFTESTDRTLSNFLGRTTIYNEVRGVREPVEQYILRHTRLSPRDIISLGNALVALAERSGVSPRELDDKSIRAEVASSSKSFGRAALAQAGNQVLANVMPWNATRHGYSDFYLGTDEYTADAMTREVSSVLLSLPGERISREECRQLEKEAESRFGQKCHFVDVLWQNRILGVEDHGVAKFYSGALVDDVAAPDADQYILNSLFIDLLPAVPLNLTLPTYPGGSFNG